MTMVTLSGRTADRIARERGMGTEKPRRAKPIPSGQRAFRELRHQKLTF